IQFLWQFPHFWAIGFLSYDQYQKAGYRLLPGNQQSIDRRLGTQTLVYTCLLLPVLVIGYVSGLINLLGLIGMIVLSCFFIWKAGVFYKQFDRASARSLMFSSFIFLPIALFILWLGM